MHEMYNGASLTCFGRWFDELIYYADISSKKNIYSILPKEILYKIKYRRIFIPEYRRGVKAVFRQFSAVCFNVLIVLASKSDDTIVINYNTMIANYPMNWVLKVVNRKVLIVCHGEMVDLIVERKTSSLFKRSKRFFSDQGLRIANGFYFAVLGDVIKTNLRPYLSSQIYQRMMSLDHPFIYDLYNIKNNSKSSVVKVGFIGALRPSKGLHEFARLAASISALNKDIKFYVAGNNSKYEGYLSDHMVNQMSGYSNRILSRKEMYEAASNLDYIVSLQKSIYYNYTASGSVFDFINCNVPVLALKNEYFVYLENKFGSYGELFDDVKSLEDYLHELARGSKCYDFSSFKNKHGMKELCENYKRELLKANLINPGS